MSQIDYLAWHGAHAKSADAPHARKRLGVYYGIVKTNDDQGKDSKYKLELVFPWLPKGKGGEEKSRWARVLVPMAGADRGTYFLPEPGDQVLVVFEQGDIEKPIVIGAMWSSEEPPPETNSDGKNDFRVIKSRSGHRAILDDKKGSERVIVCDSTNKNVIELDSANKVVTIRSAEGDIELLASSGAVRLHGKKVNITTKSTLAGKGTQALHVNSGSSIDVKASGDLRMQAASIQINPGGGPGKKKKNKKDKQAKTPDAAAAPDQQVAAKTSMQAPGGPGGMPDAAGGMPGISGSGGLPKLPDVSSLAGSALSQALNSVPLTGIEELDATIRGALQSGIQRGLIDGEGLQGMLEGMLKGGASALTKELLDDLTDIEIVDKLISDFGGGFVGGVIQGGVIDGKELGDAVVDGLEAGGIDAAKGAGQGVIDLIKGGGKKEPDTPE